MVQFYPLENFEFLTESCEQVSIPQEVKTKIEAFIQEDIAQIKDWQQEDKADLRERLEAMKTE